MEFLSPQRAHPGQEFGDGELTIRLFLLQPEIIFKALVNQASFTYPLDQVTFDNVSVGTYSVINMGETILFGSTEGGDDYGRQRVRLFPTSSILYFGRSSQGTRDGEVDLADNAHITVLRDHRVWSKTPFIDSDGTIYKDSTIAYTDQNEEPPPVANAGPAVCATVNGSDIITVTFDAANSFVTAAGASIASYFWDIDDGSFINGTSNSDSSVDVTFPPGFRWIQLRVADDNAKFHDTFVPVFARDPDNDDSILDFEIESHRITAEGQELRIRIREDIPASTYPDGTLVLLWEDEPSGPTDRSNLLFCGWVQDEQAMIEANTTGTLQDVVLRCVDVGGRLKELPGFPTILENDATPANWNEYLNPNIDTYLHHLLQWQSTALDLADWSWSGVGSSYPFKILSSEGASLWDQVSRKAEAMIPPYKLTVNTLGQMHVLVDPMTQPTGSRTSTIQVTLDADDYSDVQYNHIRPPRVHWVRANTIIADSSSVLTAFSIAPGTAPGQGERAIDDGEHIAVDQTALNVYAGHKYARLNARQSQFRITLAEGSTQGIEPANMTWVRLTIPAAVAAQRGLTFSNTRGLPLELDVRYSHTNTGLIKTVQLLWERETSGTAGTTVTVAAAEEVETGDYNIPGAESDAFSPNLGASQNVVGFVNRAGSIYTCSDFTSPGTPTWSRNTTAASGAGFSGSPIRTFVIDPFSPGYRGTGTEIRAYCVTGAAIYRINDLFGTPSYTSLHTLSTAPGGAAEWAQIACSFGRFEAEESDNPWIMCAYSAATGSNPLRTYVVYSRDAGQTWSSEIDVSGFTRTQVQQEVSWPAIYMSPKTPGLAYVGAWVSPSGAQPNAQLFRSNDWGATWNGVSALDGSTGQGLGFSLHIPWEDNPAEDIGYFGHFNRDSNIFRYRLYRSVGGSATNISPTDTGKVYGPARGLFSVRCLDSNRQYVLLAGVSDETDNEPVISASSAAVAAVWLRDDAGNTWSRITNDQTTGTTDDCTLQAAFSPNDPDVIYMWGGGGYIAYTSNGGSTVTDKQPVSPINSSSEIVGIFGGPTV